MVGQRYLLDIIDVIYGPVIGAHPDDLREATRFLVP